MKTLYDKILERVIKRADKLRKLPAKSKEFKVERIKFIDFCLQNKLTYEEIASLLGISKGRVYQIAHYIYSKKVDITKNKK